MESLLHFTFCLRCIKRLIAVLYCEFGYNIASDGLHIHDLHATIMHLLGIDHERLTYKFQGRRYRLTDIAGKVQKGLLA